MNRNRDELTEAIIQLWKRMGHSLGKDAPEAWLELSLTIGQLKSLLFIDYEGSTNFKRLAAALGVTPPNVTGIVDRLVEHELVSRSENPENRRMQILRLTEKGTTLLNELKERKVSQLTALLSRMDTQDLFALEQGLAALTRTAGRSEECFPHEYN
ncbi:MAG: MarR family transcriptional regulator [Dehalococcoidales bacterium]|nr:MarR family transcriptional regulator [Dehalococcoidales bacterium]